MSVGVEQEKIFEAFTRWLTDNGGNVSSLRLQYEAGSDERGVFLTDDVKGGNTILKLPLDCLLTSQRAKEDTAVARRLWKINPKFKESDLIALVVHLLATRNDTQHFFKPFYDTLPKNLSHFPIFWNEEQLNWLQGSTAGIILEERKANLKKDYDKLCEAIPEFFDSITFEEFLEARTLVGSRNFYFKEAGVIAMVPFADMLNHAFPSQTEWNFNPKKKLFTMKTVGKGSAGEEIYSTYGAKPNLHYFLYYGFAVDDNRAKLPHYSKVVPMNKVMHLKLELDREDPIRNKRQAVLEKCIIKLIKIKIRRQSVQMLAAARGEDVKDVEIKGEQGEKNTDFKHYSLAMHYVRDKREDPVKEVLNFFRVKCATESQLDKLIAELPDFDPKNKKNIDPSLFIDAHNEADALEALADFCANQLKTYPETYKQNLKRLKDEDFSNDKLRRLALLVVTGEQEIYNFWRAIADICAPTLRKFSVDAVTRLKAALGALPQETDFERDLHDVAFEIAENVRTE